jgi:hypothetical protein
MATYAVIKENIVINTIEAPSLEDAQEATGFTCVEYTTENPAAIGWAYDGTSFIVPVIEMPTGPVAPAIE